MKTLAAAFGSAVRARRVELGMSQEALAAEAGIHRTYISAIELGKVSVGLDVSKKVAEALHLSLAQLIERAESSRGRR